MLLGALVDCVAWHEVAVGKRCTSVPTAAFLCTFPLRGTACCDLKYAVSLFSYRFRNVLISWRT